MEEITTEEYERFVSGVLAEVKRKASALDVFDTPRTRDTLADLKTLVDICIKLLDAQQ